MDAQALDRLGAQVAAGRTLTGDELDGLGDDVFGSRAIGLVWDSLALDRVAAHLVADERHHQPHGIVHGGVWCSVVESIASVGATLQVIGTGKVIVGVSNSTDFLRAHRAGRVDAVGEPIHVGRLQQLWQVVLTRADDGKAVARGQVRLHNLDPQVLGA